MSSQLLNIVNDAGEVIGIETRAKIHQEGLLHREINVLLYTSKGELIFQRRAASKDTFPNMLDAACGGHVDIGDDYSAAALRELKEETGLAANPEELHFIDQIHINVYDPSTKTRNNALQNVYALRYDKAIEDLRVEPGKAVGFESWPIQKLLHLSHEEEEQFIFPHFGPEYMNILRKIEELAEVRK